MGAVGSFDRGVTNIESNRNYKTIFSIGDNIKVLENKNSKKGVKLPEESHTPNRIYVTFYKDGHGLKAIAKYGKDGKKIFEIHTIDHKGLGAHYHTWKDGKPDKAHSLTPEFKKLLSNILNFKAK